MLKCGDPKVAGIQGRVNNEEAEQCIYNTISGFLQVITISPLSGILSLIYKVIEGLFPCIHNSRYQAMSFDAVGSYIEGSSDISHVKWLSLLLLLGYGVKQIFLYISSITVNAGVYEKVVNNSKGYLYKKCSEIPLIEYEKAETMDRKIGKRVDEQMKGLRVKGAGAAASTMGSSSPRSDESTGTPPRSIISSTLV